MKMLGSRLRRRRLDLGLLQRKVARAMGVRVETVRNWERNKTAPQGRFLARIIRFLGGGIEALSE
jgi:transcriptional regulator with XRE-family HTH domain